MSLAPRPDFPFAAVVGHDELKLALLLATVDPSIGGVLLRGDKGSGKTTLVRGLAAVLPRGAPFVELPLGATEDRVLGSIDLAAALTEGEERVRSGLLAGAHGGVLFVDEVNLLADHLVDTLLDVAASGRHRLERDGVSVVQPARFVLVGTMNPEEGELRPQLLDRFGLCVTVQAPACAVERAEIVRRRLAFEAGGALPGAAEREVDLAGRLARARPAALDDEVVAFACRLALAVGAEGLRADLVLCRAAAALAGWEARDRATPDDVERVAHLVLAHRRRRTPGEPPVLPPEGLRSALDEARGAPPREGGAGAEPGAAGGAPGEGGGNGTHGDGEGDAHGSWGAGDEGDDGGAARAAPGRDDGGDARAAPDRSDAGTRGQGGGETGAAGSDARRGSGGVRADADARHLPGAGGGCDATRPVALGAERGAPVLPTPAGRATGAAGAGAAGAGAGRRTPAPGRRGRLVRDVPVEAGTGIAVAATVRNVARRRAVDPTATAEAGDLRAGAHVERTGALVVVALDVSGSMGVRARVEAATGAVLGLLTEAYQRRDRVAVVTFGGGEARVALAPTGSVEVARARLAGLATGGTTPLAEGLRLALDVATARPRPGAPPRPATVVVVTDGRATGAPGAGDAALAAAGAVRAAGVAALVLDAETGVPRLGLASRLADAMGAACLPVSELRAGTLRAVAAGTLGGPR